MTQKQAVGNLRTAEPSNKQSLRLVGCAVLLHVHKIDLLAGLDQSSSSLFGIQLTREAFAVQD